MKIIDNKGRIFGLVNYIDLIFVLIVIFLIGRFTFKGSNVSQIIDTGNLQQIEGTYLINELRMTSIENIKEGDIFKNIDTNEVIGELVSKEVKPSKFITTDQNGKAIYSEIPDKFDVYLKLKIDAQITDEEIIVGNEELRIGQKLLIQSQINEFEAMFYGIEYK